METDKYDVLLLKNEEIVATFSSNEDNGLGARLRAKVLLPKIKSYYSKRYSLLFCTDWLPAKVFGCRAAELMVKYTDEGEVKIDRYTVVLHIPRPRLFEERRIIEEIIKS